MSLAADAIDGLLHSFDVTALATSRPPYGLLVFGHALAAVEATRDFSRYWLVSLAVACLASFGGGTISALLIQARNPSAAVVGLLGKNEVGIAHVAAWWLFHYAPGRPLARAWDALPPLRAASKACRAVLRATTIVHRVNAAVAVYPGVLAAPLLLGTLGGAGGRLSVDAFAYCSGYKQGPTELSHPGYSLRSAGVCALLQYALVHVLGVLSSQQGLGLVIAIHLAQSAASELTGSPCDYTAPLARLFYTLTAITDPATVPAWAAALPKPRTPRAPKGARAAAGTKKAAQGANGSGGATPRRTSGEEEATPRRSTRRRAAAGTAN